MEQTGIIADRAIMDAVLAIDELAQLQHRCPPVMAFRCGGTRQQPKRSCIQCWMDYFWWTINGEDDRLGPRDTRPGGRNLATK